MSAMIKSIRGGDEEAALYWLAVQLAAGDDGRHAARRLVVAAGEEVGAADPRALPMAVAALDAVERVGMPEAHYPLAATVAYLCRTGRDWWPGAALHRAVELVGAEGPDPVPPHLRPAAKTYRHPSEEPPEQHHQQYRPKRRATGFLGDRPAPRPPRAG
jgi:putative ATPase